MNINLNTFSLYRLDKRRNLSPLARGWIISSKHRFVVSSRQLSNSYTHIHTLTHTHTKTNNKTQSQNKH